MNTQITDTTLIFFGFSVVTSFLAMIIIAISVAYYRLSRKAHMDREDFLKRQEDAKLTENQIITEARKKSQEIMSQAQAQAQQMLSASEVFSSEYKQEFRAKLLKVIEKEEKEFEALYTGIKTESSSVINNLSQNIGKEISAELSQFKLVLQTQIDNMIKEYKQTAYARLEQEVSELVQTISRRVLRKSISQEEHTQLVMKAMEEAKQNNVF